MQEIKRLEVDEFWADSTVIDAGDYVFVGYCMGNEGQTIEQQMDGAFDTLEKRLAMAGLGFDDVVKMDCLFKDIQDLNYLPDAIRKRFSGRYPTRKAYTTDFIRDGILFQIDAIACRNRKG